VFSFMIPSFNHHLVSLNKCSSASMPNDAAPKTTSTDESKKQERDVLIDKQTLHGKCMGAGYRKVDGAS